MLKYLFALVAILGLAGVSEAQYRYGYQYQYQATPYGYNYNYRYGYQYVPPAIVVPAYPYSYGPYGNYGRNPLLRGNNGYQNWYGQRPFAYPGTGYGFGFWR